MIPDVVMLEGTTRDFNPKVEEVLKKRISELTNKTAEGFNCKAEIQWCTPEYPVVMNHERETGYVIKAAEKVLGKEMVDSEDLPVMGAEDFSLYLQKVPGSFFFVGAVSEKHPPVVHHASNFNANDESLPCSVKVMMAIAQERLDIQLYSY